MEMGVLSFVYVDYLVADTVDCDVEVGDGGNRVCSEDAAAGEALDWGVWESSGGAGEEPGAGGGE